MDETDATPLDSSTLGSPDRPPPPDLRAQVVGGIGWKIATQAVTQGSRTVVGVLLARLLAPHDFGLAAMAFAFTALAPLFTDLSLGAALVQRATITEEDRCTAYWTTVAASLATTAAAIAAAPLVGDFFHNKAVAPLFAVNAITFTVSGLSSTQFALLNREMQFRSLQIREIAAIVVSSIGGIAIALAGGGAWAIVLQWLIADCVSTVLVWRFSTWRPRRIYSFASLRELGPYGAKTLGSRFLGYVRLNADNLLIGRYGGSAALGVYTIAYNLMFAPITRITQPVQQVLFPAFSRMQTDRGRIGDAWIRGSRLLAALTAPAFLGIAAVAPDFVPVVLGQKWQAAIPVLQLLSLAGVVLSIEQLNSSVLQGVGRVGTLLRYMTVSTIVIVLAFATGIQWGVKGVALGYLIACLLLAPAYLTITARSIGVSRMRYIRSVLPVIEGAVVMGGSVYASRFFLEREGVHTGLRLFICVVEGVAIYVGYLALRVPTVLDEFRVLSSGFDFSAFLASFKISRASRDR